MSEPNGNQLEESLHSKPAAIMHHMEVEAVFSGPLPPPSTLAAYDRVHPGAANRIIEMAEQRASHRESMERLIADSSTKNERIGMWFAFMLTGALMGIGGLLVAKGKDTVGYLAVFLPVIFHAGNYIYIKHTERQHPEDAHQ